jgi:hypothetical protein
MPFRTYRLEGEPTVLPLAAIKPNPYRDIARFPLDEVVVTELMGSVRRNGFIQNIVGRSDGNGGVELAFGHHRVEAIRRLNENASVEVQVRPLDDIQMLQHLADDNVRDHHGRASAHAPMLVRAAVEALKQGAIIVPISNEDRASDGIRYAPSFVPSTWVKHPAYNRVKGGIPYTARTIVDVYALKRGVRSRDIISALDRLALIELCVLMEAQLDALTGVQARVLVDEAAKSMDSDPKGYAATALVEAMLAEFGRVPKGISMRRVGSIIGAAVRGAETKTKRGEAAGPLSRGLDAMFRLDFDKRVDRLDRVIESIRSYKPSEIDTLVRSLRGVAFRSRTLADRLEKEAAFRGRRK